MLLWALKLVSWHACCVFSFFFIFPIFPIFIQVVQNVADQKQFVGYEESLSVRTQECLLLHYLCDFKLKRGQDCTSSREGRSLCQLVSAGQGPKGGMFSSTRETNTSKKPSGCRNKSMLCSVKAFLSCVVGLLGCFFHLCDFLGLAAFLRVFDSRLPETCRPLPRWSCLTF